MQLADGPVSAPATPPAPAPDAAEATDGENSEDSDSASSNSDSDGEVDEAVFGDPEALRALPRDRVEAALKAAAAGGRHTAVEELLARGVVDARRGDPHGYDRRARAGRGGRRAGEAADAAREHEAGGG